MNVYDRVRVIMEGGGASEDDAHDAAAEVYVFFRNKGVVPTDKALRSAIKRYKSGQISQKMRYKTESEFMGPDAENSYEIWDYFAATKARQEQICDAIKALRITDDLPPSQREALLAAMDFQSPIEAAAALRSSPWDYIRHLRAARAQIGWSESDEAA